VKILVTGAAGQLGSTIAHAYASRAQIVPVTRQLLDMADPAAVEAFVAREKPDAVINCAAYNDVDGAEDHAVDAIRVNALAVRALARGARDAGATLVHYGTDFVFDGLIERPPYSEDDEPAPQSVYGASKLLGEWFAADAPRHYVLRVESLFGGTQRRSSVDRIADAIRKGQPARVFVDRTVTSSYVQDVADATWTLLQTRAPEGVYHCVNSGVTTWFELAQEIGRILEVEPDLVAVKVADVKLKARRPQYAALSNAKLAAAAGVVMPTWQDALRRYLSVSS
jgi:dTDP-4-dehydrorhamnose reductase